MSRKKLSILVISPGLPGRIREIRKKLGLSQEKLGSLLGVQKPTISRYESGRVPDEETLKKIANIGNTSIDWLLYGDKDLSEQEKTIVIESSTFASPAQPQLPEPDELIIIESPALPSILNSPYIYGALDINGLAQIIELLEELLSHRKKRLKPVKYALLLSLLYDEFQKTGQPLNQATLKAFLRRVD